MRSHNLYGTCTVFALVANKQITCNLALPVNADTGRSQSHQSAPTLVRRSLSWTLIRLSTRLVSYLWAPPLLNNTYIHLRGITGAALEPLAAELFLIFWTVLNADDRLPQRPQISKRLAIPPHIPP